MGVQIGVGNPEDTNREVGANSMPEPQQTPTKQTEVSNLNDSRFLKPISAILTLIRVGAIRNAADPHPNLTTKVYDALGAILKVSTVVVSVVSVIGSYSYLNECISSGVPSTFDKMGLFFTAVCNTKFTGLKSTAYIAAAIGAASLALPFSEAAAGGAAVALGLALYNFMEAVQKRSFRSDFNTVTNDSSAEDTRLAASLNHAGATLSGITKAVKELILGKDYSFDTKTQQVIGRPKPTLALASLGCLYLLGYSVVGTIMGFFSPTFAFFATKRAKEETGVAAKAAIVQHVNDLRQNTIASLQRPLIDQMYNEVTGKASAPSGAGNSYREKLQIYTLQTGHEISDQDFADLLTEEGRNRLINRPPKPSSNLGVLLATLENRSQFQQGQRFLTELTDESPLHQWRSAPQQHRENVNRAIQSLADAISDSDKTYVDGSLTYFKDNIKGPLDEAEKRSAQRYGTQLKLAQIEPPTSNPVAITPPNFEYPTASRMWSEWVAKSGGGVHGQVLAGLQLFCLCALAGAMEVTLLLANINWKKTGARLSRSWREGVKRVALRLAGNLASANDLSTFFEPRTQETLRTITGGRGFSYYKLMAIYTVAFYLMSFKLDEPTVSAFKAPDKSSVSAIKAWRNRFSMPTQLLLGRQHWAQEGQVPIAQLRFSAVMGDLRKMSDVILTNLPQGTNTNIKTLLQESFCELLLRRADKQYSLFDRILEKLAWGEAPDEVRCEYGGKAIVLSYYQVEALAQAMLELRNDILTDQSNLAPEWAAIMDSWTSKGDNHKRPKRGSISTAFRGFNSFGTMMRGEAPDLVNPVYSEAY